MVKIYLSKQSENFTLDDVLCRAKEISNTRKTCVVVFDYNFHPFKKFG